MSRSRKTGKGWRKVLLNPEFPNGHDPIFRRYSWGSTHRIRRRHRQLWARALGKLRRAHDRRIVAEGLKLT